jgi:ABC-type uncharacterized transport system permease subunit
MILIANIVAITLYLVGACYQGNYLLRQSATPPRRVLLLSIGTGAVTAHAISALGALYSGNPIDLGFFNVSSLIFWFITTLTLLSTLRRPLDSLLVGLFPLAALSIVVSSFSPQTHEVSSTLTAGMLSHILASILAYSVLTIAAIQATALAIQEHQLKSHHTHGIIESLPPLQTMEQMLFEVIWIGVALLTVSIVTGALFIDDIFAQSLVHKTSLSITAWIIFATLLWGRHQRGWRSQTAIRWTLGGFIALMLSYFGSKLVLEIILQRA